MSSVRDQESYIRRLTYRGLLLVVSGVVTACAGSLQAGAGAAAKSGHRDTKIEHEDCDLSASGAVAVDVNGDGKADLTTVKSGEREKCRGADLDFDGRVDMWTYFDDAGGLRRRELDFDRDGQIDEIQLFKSGVISEKHRASSLAHRLDTWDSFEAGKLVRSERDSDGDGRVDQWWEFANPDCPTIRSDVDGNGEPDPTAVVNYCQEASSKPPEISDGKGPEMLKKDVDALPKEESNKESTDANPAADTAKAKPPAKSDAKPKESK